MTIAEKYEELEQLSSSITLAKHRRLERLTQIYRIARPKERGGQLHIQTIASQLGKLDHPLIPHLIEFQEEDSAYVLIREGVVHQDTHSAQLDSDEGLLDHLSILEQATDALRHAARRGIAHGDFSRDSIRTHTNELETQRTVKVLGLGRCQLESHHSVDTKSDPDLFREDLSNLKRVIREALAAHQTASTNLAAAKEKLSKRISPSVEDTIETFSADFRAWIQHQRAQQEAQRLAICETERTQDTKRRDVKEYMLVAATVGVVLLSLGILTYLLWPTGQERITTSNRNSPSPAATSVSSSTELPKHVPQQSVNSSLSEVGALNNASDAEASMANNSPNEATEVTEVTKTEAPTVAAGSEEAPEDGQADVNDVSEEPSSKMKDAEAATSQSVRRSSPFQSSATMAELPPRRSRDVIELLQTSLKKGEPIDFSIHSDAKTNKQTTFSIQKRDNKQWRIDGERREKSYPIATLVNTDGLIEFRWLDGVDDLTTANQLRNTVVRISSGRWTHLFQLRKIDVRPPTTVNLENNRPIDLGISDLPNGLYLEFLPSKDSLAVAAPTTISWREESMMIGLDAGKRSLVLVDLRPQPRGRLQTFGFFRQRVSGPKAAIKKGFGRGIRANMQALNQNLFGLKRGVKLIKGEDADEKRKQANAMIKHLEETKRIGEAFFESYSAAVTAKLSIRVYCEPGGQRLTLLEFRASDEEEVAAD